MKHSTRLPRLESEEGERSYIYTVRAMVIMKMSDKWRASMAVRFHLIFFLHVWSLVLERNLTLSADYCLLYSHAFAWPGNDSRQIDDGCKYSPTANNIQSIKPA